MDVTLVDYNLPVKVPASIPANNGELVSQGAEALVFLLAEKAQVVKFRPAKLWRLAELDGPLRQRRTTQEARVMQKLAAGGIGVPKLEYVDAKTGLICMEHIKGRTLKMATWEVEGALTPEVRRLYREFGIAVARMHALGIMHGDLTTSNAMVDSNNQLKIIDFGLSTQNATFENKAVDLYVLERAIGSTHPLEVETLMSEEFIPAYTQTAHENKEQFDRLMTQLEKTRAGGRKRTQLG